MNQGASVAAAYTDTNYYRDVTHSWTTGIGNVSGNLINAIITNLYCNSGGLFSVPCQTGVVPAIPKDNTKTMTLTFRFSWARH